MSSHTPGPWTAKPTASLGPQYKVYADDDTIGADIAIVYDHGNTQANANLIAAAPCLLEAATWLMAELSSRFDYVEATPEEETVLENMANAIRLRHDRHAGNSMPAMFLNGPASNLWAIHQAS